MSRGEGLICHLYGEDAEQECDGCCLATSDGLEQALQQSDAALGRMVREQRLPDSPDFRAKFNDDGTLDEVVIGPGAWLHAEEMDRDSRGYRYWSVGVGNVLLSVRVSRAGRAIHTTIIDQGDTC